MRSKYSWTRRVFLACSGAALVLAGSPAWAGPLANLPDSPLIKRIQEAGVLRAGVATFLPIIGQDPKTGEYFGTGVDIANWMADDLGVTVEFIPQDWSTMVAAIQAQQIDVAVAGLYATPERLKVVDMLDYVSMGFCYAALKTNDKVNTLEDLNQPSVVFAQLEGGGTYQFTKKFFPNATHKARIGLPGEVVAWPEVLSGEADIAVFDPPLIAAVKKDLPQLKVIPEDCSIEKSHMPSPIAFAYPKGDAGFTQYGKDLVARHKADISKSLVKYSAPEYISLGEGN